MALVVHAVGAALVVGYTMKLAGDHSEKPDPVVEARLEDEQSAG